MDNNLSQLARQLEGFEAVWKRVTASKSAAGAAQNRDLKLMPKKDASPKNRRFTPGHKPGI